VRLVRFALLAACVIGIRMPGFGVVAGSTTRVQPAAQDSGLPSGGRDGDSPDAPFAVVAASGSEVRVDLGVDASRSQLVREAIVLGPSGAIPAGLVRLERKCESPCGDDGTKECHFDAILLASRRVGEAIAVLPGTPRVEAIVVPKAGADEALADTDTWIAAGPIDKPDDTRYAWARFPDGVFLTSSWLGREFYAPPIALSECVRRSVDPFTVISCPTAELLYEGQRGLVASFADYGEQKAVPILGFKLDGRQAFLIRLGLKAEMTVALLVREDNGWRVTFRRADYPLLC
jgi:hypothetical protein